MKRLVPGGIAIASALIFGAVAHEYAWPHYTLVLSSDGVIKNVETAKWEGSFLRVGPGATNASVENVKISLPHGYLMTSAAD
jgi:hypothetical protein